MTRKSATTSANSSRQDATTLQQKVFARAAMSQSGFMSAFMVSPLAKPGPATQRSPPVDNGLTHCVTTAVQIVQHDQRNEFHKIPTLLRRIRHLVRVYYDFIAEDRRTPELMTFCDFKYGMHEDVMMKLHKIGLYLQLDTPRLWALMKAGGESLESFLLEEELDVPANRKTAKELKETGDTNKEDLAASVFSYFMGDVNVAFVMNKDNKAAGPKRKVWAEKAERRLIRWSTEVAWRDMLGDPLTDALLPIYLDKDALIKFSHAGGLASLFGDWINSGAKMQVERVLRDMPEEVWDNQTESSLAAITREIMNKADRDIYLAAQVKTDIEDPIFASAFLNIHKRYGVKPFSAAALAENFDNGELFSFLSHTLKIAPSPTFSSSSPPSSFDKQETWAALLTQYKSLSKVARKKHSWANLDLETKWLLIEGPGYGCEHDDCPERAFLLHAREGRDQLRSMMNSWATLEDDAKLDERVVNWGLNKRACTGCEKVAYCSAECQKADWKYHKNPCKFEKFRREKQSSK